MRILIVEDSGLARKMLRATCKKFFPDAEFIPAENGQLGLEAFRDAYNQSKPFDIVFIDQLMPVMDGLAAASQILALKTNTFVVMVTANIQSATRSEAEAIGIKEFIHKPISEEKMQAIFSRWNQDQASTPT